MSTTLILIRHAAHDRLDKVLCGRMAGVSLGRRGLEQAAALGGRLHAGREPVAAIYTSPLERARQTAQPVGDALSLEPRVDADLDEIDVGAWTGRSFDALQDDPAWTTWNAARLHSRPPGGESLLEAQARVVRWMERARAAHPQQAVAAVSHADVIKAAVAWALSLSLDFYGRFEIAPASVTRLEIGDWGAKLIALNAASPP